MKKLIIKAICLTCLMMIHNLVTFSQIKTIDYLTSGLSTSACNVFNPQVTLNGVIHTSYAGGANFNSTYGLGLTTTPQNSPPGGTAYVINYNFIPGTKYDIAITAIGNSAIVLKTSVVPNFNQFTTNGTTSCTPDNFAYSYITAGYGQSSNPTSTSSTTYTIPQFTITGNNVYPYLIVWASGGRSNLALDVLYVSKVVITPTTAASFNITPSPTTISCGQITPVTFTANGTNVPPGATISYIWNLGVNNGWQYGGAAAGATITTTTNILTLTPTCGSALSNVSATVTVNGTANNANSSSILIVQPSYSISGNSSICSGTSNYTINGLVCNSSLAWTPPLSSLGSLSSLTTSPTTLTYGGTSGNFNLTANVTSCGVSTPVTLPIHVGAYTSANYTLTSTNSPDGQPLNWCPNQSYSFVIGGGNPASNYSWTIPTGWTTLYNGGYMVVLKSPSSTYPPTGNVSVSFTEPCGTTITASKFVANSSNCSSNDPRFKVYPNPFSNYINVEVDLTYPNNSNTHIVGIQLLNPYGTIVYSQNFPNSPGNFYQGYQFPIYNLAPGQYTLRVYDGTNWSAYMIMH